MPDNLKPEHRRKAMRAVKSKATSLERRLFSMLARMGLRGWRQNDEDVVGHPDVVFEKQRVVLFVDGCFWHGCPSCRRKLPLTNREYWERKINRNVSLARSYNRRLRADGWTVVRIWEHDLSRSQMRERIRTKIRESVVGSHGGQSRNRKTH